MIKITKLQIQLFFMRVEIAALNKITLAQDLKRPDYSPKAAFILST